MAKDKKLKSNEIKKETPFYFEAIGFISIIIAIIIFGKLGKVGIILTMFFKVSFGDWYWLIVAFAFIYGICNIFTHKSFNFSNQRFIGYILCVIGILVISHFPVHNYIESKEGSYISNTWSYYKIYISNQYDVYLGGGLIGGFIFIIAFYLLGILGVILIALLTIVLGFTMIINKSITEIAKDFWKSIKKVKVYTGNFNNFFKYEIGKKKDIKKDIYDYQKTVSLKAFDDYQHEINHSFQEKLSQEIKSLIVSIFNTLNLEYREIDMNISYSVTSYKYYIYTKFNEEIISNKLKDLIEDQLSISFQNNIIIIEINNKYNTLLTFKNLLYKQSILKNNYNIPFGINTSNDLEEVDLSNDANILLIGEKNCGIKNFIYYLIMALLVKVNLCYYEFHLYSQNNDFIYNELFKSINNNELKDYLNDITTNIEKRKKMLKVIKSNTIEEYNIKQEIENNKIMKRMIYIINLNNKIDKIEEDKLIYIMQMGKLCGISLIIISRDIKNITDAIYSIIRIKMIGKLNREIDSIHIINNNKANYLNRVGEFIYLYKDKEVRIQSALINNDEIKKAINICVK